MSDDKKDYARVGSDWLPPGATAPASHTCHLDSGEQHILHRPPVEEEMPQTPKPSSLSIVLWVTLGVALVVYPSLLAVLAIFFMLTCAIGVYLAVTGGIKSVLKKLF